MNTNQLLVPRGLATAIALTLVIGLSACAGMSRQDQNTAIGAGVGAVGGAVLTGGGTLGTLGGAAIGGVICARTAHPLAAGYGHIDRAGRSHPRPAGDRFGGGGAAACDQRTPPALTPSSVLRNGTNRVRSIDPATRQEPA